MHFIVLAALFCGVIGFSAGFFLTTAIGVVAAVVGGLATLLGWRMLAVSANDHGSAAFGGAIVGVTFLGGGVPLLIGSLLGLLMH